LKSDKRAEVRGLGKLECIVGERNDFVFERSLTLSQWIDLTTRLMSLGDSASAGILDDGGGSFEVDKGADAE
jgi:hypothetical protein